MSAFYPSIIELASLHLVYPGWYKSLTHKYCCTPSSVISLSPISVVLFFLSLSQGFKYEEKWMEVLNLLYSRRKIKRRRGKCTEGKVIMRKWSCKESMKVHRRSAKLNWQNFREQNCECWTVLSKLTEFQSTKSSIVQLKHTGKAKDCCQSVQVFQVQKL